MEVIQRKNLFGISRQEILEVRVRLLYGEGKRDIISQYVDFTKVYHEQVKLHGRTKETVQETIRICKDRDVLRNYLSSREKEVVDIMMALFDQQKAVEQFGDEKKREGRQEGRLEEKRETAQTLFKMGMSVDYIAKAVKVGTEFVQQWLSGMSAAKP